MSSASAQHDHGTEAPTKPNEVFEKIKALEGNWKGTYKWVGRDSEGPMEASYYLTGNGSAVVENLISNGEPTMTTVYHLDGNDLRMTHYCAAKNQPRLKANHIYDNNSGINFRFVDITNLKNEKAGYVTNLELTFLDSNKIKLIFTFTTDGKESFEHIELNRDVKQ